MYAKLCSIEILSSYIKEVSIGDLLTVQALVTNPLDWQYFYDKISAIREGEKTEFLVVTAEGDRLQGQGDIVEMGKWNYSGHYGFKIKIRVRKQKSLRDRRTRTPKRPVSEKAAELGPQPAAAAVEVAPEVSLEDAARFKELLKGSLAMDISR